MGKAVKAVRPDFGELQGSSARKLVVRMTDERLKEVAGMVTEAAVDLSRLREQKRAAVRDFNGDIAGKEETLFKFSKVYADGGEEQDVACEIFASIEANTKTVVRTDTQEVVEQSALTAKEREALEQGSLFPVTPPPDAAAPEKDLAEDEEEEEEVTH